MAVTFDLEDLQLRPEKDTLLMEMIHAVSRILLYAKGLRESPI